MDKLKAFASNFKWGIVYFLLGLWAFIQLFPLYWMLSFSLKDNTEIFSTNPIGLPQQWLFSNYREAIAYGNVARYFLNSIIVTSLTILIVVVFGLMATYALTRMVWRGQKAMNAFYSLGLIMPIHAALLPVYIILSNMKIVNGYLGLIIPYSAFALSMAILICAGFIISIPRELEESACLDGCSIYGIFGRIILPLMRPAISVVAIFTFLQSWNELLFANTFIKRPAYKTLTVGIMALAGEHTTRWGRIGAGMVIITLPTLAIYILLSEQVQKSLVLGAVKG